MDRIHREERLDRLAQCPMGHDTRHYYRWLDEIDELTKQNAKLLEACKGLIGILTPKQYERQFPHVYQKAKQAIAEAEGQL